MKFTLKIELDVDDQIFNPEDSMESDWFYHTVMCTERLELWSKEIGDHIGLVIVNEIEPIIDES